MLVDEMRETPRSCLMNFEVEGVPEAGTDLLMVASAKVTVGLNLSREPARKEVSEEKYFEGPAGKKGAPIAVNLG